MTRVEQADLLLAQAERARHEQARAAALEERTRIAREIYDVPAHSLGALAVHLDVTEALLDNGADNALGPNACRADPPAPTTTWSYTPPAAPTIHPQWPRTSEP
ncbi:MAG TPA: histidine kinase [Nakamurella sp.]|jgi:hypothetical protein